MKNIIKTILTLCILFNFDNANAVSVGSDAPIFKTSDIKGASVDISALTDKIIVLEWTNPGCPFVKKHYDSNNMQQLQKTYTEKGIIWISINSSAEGREGYFAKDSEAQTWIDEKTAAPTHYIRDRFGEIGKSYRATTTPQIFIINKSKIVYAGAIDNIPSANKDDVAKAENYVSKALDEVIAGKEVSSAKTNPYGCSVKY